MSKGQNSPVVDETSDRRERKKALAELAGATGGAIRWGDPQVAEQKRRELAAARIEEYVQRVVANAPPLTDDQRNRITMLLRPAAGGAA